MAESVAPVVSTLGGSWPPVAPAVSALVVAHRPSVAPAVSTPGYAARRESASPAVSTRRSAHRPLVAPKVSSASSSSLVPAPWCLLHGSIRVGPGRTAVPPSRLPHSVRLPSLVPRSRDRASQGRHSVLRQH